MCNTAKLLAVRIGGLENVVLPDDETTFAQLQARISATTDLLSKLDEHGLHGMEDKEVLVTTVGAGLGWRVSEYAVLNFHFHMASAYCILRHLGVPIGAGDYLRNVFERLG